MSRRATYARVHRRGILGGWIKGVFDLYVSPQIVSPTLSVCIRAIIALQFWAVHVSQVFGQPFLVWKTDRALTLSVSVCA